MQRLYSLALGTLLVVLLAGNLHSQSEDVSVNKPRTAPAQYRIGNGDALHISVWGQDQLTSDAVVRPDGKISMPLISDVSMDGLSVPEAEDRLADALTRYVKKPLVTVSIVEAKSKVVYVTGEVLRPGGYLLLGPTSALQLVVRAGGPTDFAKLKKAYVLRAGGGRLSINLKDVLRGKRLNDNAPLAVGDTVVIP